MDGIQKLQPQATSPLPLADCPHRVTVDEKLHCKLVSKFSNLDILQCTVGADACRACMSRTVAPETPCDVVASMTIVAVRAHAPDAMPQIMEQMRPFLKTAQLAPARRATAADLPCIHRGELLRIVECELCGSKGVQVEVHQCRLPSLVDLPAEQRECVPGRWSNDPTKPPHRRCLECTDRTEPVQIELLQPPVSQSSAMQSHLPQPSKTVSQGEGSAEAIRVINEPHPRLTVGMATYDDFNGVYFTIQALRLYHRDVFPQIPPAGGVPVDWPAEIVVIDNNPTSSDGRMTRDFIASWVPEARYVPCTIARGTAVPRNQVFREARGDVVVCVDPHVLIHHGALSKLLQYADSTPQHRDLWQGPMVYDNGVGLATHFDVQWRAEMFGTWGNDARAAEIDLPPFEIPMQGLGLFACRQTEWLGFNPAFRGFGAEEGYIHEKYRLAGHRAMCLPFLRWTHRFGRPAGVPYSITRADKLRNYVIGWSELGLPLDSIYEHFVKPGLATESDWQRCVDEAESLKNKPANRPFLSDALRVTKGNAAA